MRRFTLTLIAVLAVALSYAQPQRGIHQLAPKDKMAMLQQQVQVPEFAKVGKAEAMQLQKKGAAVQTQKKAPAKVEMITETPEGTVQGYARKGGFWASSLFGASYGDQSGFMKTIISEDGKTMYIRDFVSQTAAEVYVKGEISEDGKTVSVPVGQYAQNYEAYGDGLILQWCKLVVNWDSGQIIEGSYDESVEAIELSIDEDGVMTVPGSKSYVDDEGNTVYEGPGLIWDDDLSFSYYMDYESVYTPAELPEPLVAPEGLEVSDFCLVSKGYYGDESAKFVKAGWDGDDLWIQNLEPNYFPGGWIKGTKNGDKIEFPVEYLGSYYGTYDIYLLGAKGDNVNGFEMCDLVFDYDEATQTLSLDEDHIMLTNAALDRVYYLGFYRAATFAPFVEKPGVPEAPVVTAYNTYLSTGGLDSASFSIPSKTVDGNIMNPDKLSYIVYVDGEPFTFLAEEYPYLDEDMTEVPYNFTDSYDFGKGASSIYFYETAFKEIAIKVIYRGCDEEHEAMSETYVNYALPDANDVNRTNIYRSFDGDVETIGNLGTNRIETYDVAALIQDANLVGAKVKGMTIYTMPTSRKSNFQGWVSSKLGIEKVEGVAQATADVKGETTVDEESIHVSFAQPVEITEDGLFAGYSFDVDVIKIEDDAYPVALSVEPCANGFFMHTTRSYRNWVELGSSYSNAIVPIVLEFEDGTVQELGARFLEAGEYYAEVNQPKKVTLTLANNGTEDIESINYTIMLGKVAFPASEYKLEAPLSGEYYGQQIPVEIEIPAMTKALSTPVTFVVNKVNGQANDVNLNSVEGQLNVVSFVPKHRVLVEEYTGTWCGYCPRGMIGMRLLAEAFGEDFVGVAYHNGDPMESLWTNYYGFPSYVSGFPSSYLNRVQSVDPFYGSGNESFGIKNDVETLAADFAPVSVEVKAVYNDEDVWEPTIDATASVEFVKEGGQYEVEFIAIENGMNGEGSDWAQSNYYSGSTAYADDPYLSEIVDLPSSIEGLEFNDVFLGSTYYVGGAGSLPEEIKAEEQYTVDGSLWFEDFLNPDFEELWQNVANIEVIALVLDANTGAVVNAAKCKLDGVGTGIANIANDSQKNGKEIYNLAGQKVSNNFRGVVIKNGKKMIRK